MNNFWTPPTRNKRQRELAWVNGVFYSHEVFCSCNDFAFHLLSLVYPFTRGDTENSLRQILTASKPPLCLTSGEDHEPLISEDAGADHFDIDGLDGDELEKLFSDPENENTDAARDIAG